MQAVDIVPSGFRRVQLKYGPYSASRLLVARCPARFYSRYVLREPDTSDSIASARGSVIHEVLQHISEYHVTGQEVTPALLNGWVEQSVGRYPAAYEQIKLIKDAATAYVGNRSPYLVPGTECEVPLSVALYEEESFLDDVVPRRQFVKVPYLAPGHTGRRNPNPEAFLGAWIDQLSVDHDIRVVTTLDHKSTPSAASNADHDFQMGCYALLTSLFYPGYHVRTVIHYAHPRLNFYKPPVYWSAEDLQDVEQEIMMRVRAIESFEEFPALPGSHCDYCHMVQLCPANQKICERNARGDINLNCRTVDDMRELAGHVRTVGVLYDQLNKTLKQAIEANCPDSGVAIEGMWYGFRDGAEKIDWDATDTRLRREARAGTDEFEGLDALLAKHGLDPKGFMEWRDAKLNALVKVGKESLMKDLRPYLVSDKTTRFGGYKI